MLKLFDTCQTCLSFHLKLKKLIVYQKNCTVNHGSIMYNYAIFIQSMSKNSFVLGYLYFPAPGPGPGPRTRPPICIYRPWPPICVYRPWPQICIYRPWPPICVYRPWSKFLFTGLVSSKPGLADTNLVPPICIYWPWPTIFITCSEFAFTFLSIVVAVAAVLLAIVVIS